MINRIKGKDKNDSQSNAGESILKWGKVRGQESCKKASVVKMSTDKGPG